MNKKLLKKLAIAACSLTFVAAVGFGVSSVSNAPETADAAEIVLDSKTTWLEDRDYGSFFTVPMGDINGVRANTFTILAPSGKAYNSQTISLDETGKYVVTWYSLVNGKTVKAEKEFFVTKRTIGLTDGATLTTSNPNAYPNPTAGSVHLTMTEGASFTYNKVVNLNDLGGTTTSLIKVFPNKGIENVMTATSKDQYNLTEDAAIYYIKLTDCYDASNYITIQMGWSESGNYWTLYGSAVGQKPHSLYRTSKGTLQIGDDRFTLAYSPSVAYRNVTMSQKGLEFFYDNATNRIYATAYRWMTVSATRPAEDGYPKETAYTKRLFADLSNELIYPGNTFKGFTTGEVYLSITAAKYGQTGEANLDIVNIGKDKLSLDMLNSKEKDTMAPAIQVTQDFKKFSKIVVNEEVSVPKVIGLDSAVPGGIVADAKVYLDYNKTTKKGTTVNVTNGKFTPMKKGNYTIVYTATDPSGNVSTQTVDLTCVDTYTTAVSLSLANNTYEVEAGLNWAVPACTINGIYTDSSDVKVYADGKLLEDKVLFVEDVKNYKLEYVYETPFKNYTVECTVKALASDEVVFSTIYLPQYFIAGASYTLDAVMAQEFLTVKPAPYVAEVWMKAGNGAYSKINFKNVTIPTSASTVQFKYVAANGKYVESDVLQVVNVGFGGNLVKQEYFQADASMTKTASTESITYTMPSGTTMNYVNPLSVSKFNIDFLVKNADRIKFTFVDFYDRTNTLTYELIHEVSEGTTNMEVLINGISVKNAADTTFLDKQTNVTSSGGLKITTGQLLTGPFAWENTFSTDKAFFSITLTSDSGKTPSIEISRLFKTNFTNSTTDDSTPMLTLAVDNGGYQVVGKKIGVSQLIVTDLYTPFLESNLTLEVMNPDYDYVTSNDGVLLDGTCPVDREYEFTIASRGYYDVTFYYVENGRTTMDGFTCDVRDSVPPTIVVTGRTEGEILTAAYRVKVAVATYTVSDDVSEAKDIKSCIFVMYPSGLMKEVASGKTFDTTEKGLYYVVYFAYDEFGNSSTFMYKVLVS